MALADQLQSLEKLEAVANLCKRRGFIFRSSELYGGINGFWDYGPLGVELKRRIETLWLRDMIGRRRPGAANLRYDVVGLDSSIICHPDVWKASGHADKFADWMVDDLDTKERFRIDALLYNADGDAEQCEQLANAVGSVADFWEQLTSKLGYQPQNPNQTKGTKHRFTPPRPFKLMFETQVGALGDMTAFLRPETCQPIFVQFENILTSSRSKVPFGIAQIGKSFRNEITPRNFTFRSREFSQMEMEFFCNPEQASDWFEFWIDKRNRWYSNSIGVKADNLRLRPHRADELAHYAKACTDVEYQFPWGWGELEGIADRDTFDLTQHQTHSKKKLEYFDQETNQRFMPRVIETSGGLDRTLLIVLLDAYDTDVQDVGAEAKEQGKEEEARIVLRLKPSVAPVTLGILPLRKNKHGELAEKIEDELSDKYSVQYDATASIGKRYRRFDEIGTPWCVTIDDDTLADNTVTIRDRDTLEQDRISIDGVGKYVEDRLK